MTDDEERWERMLRAADPARTPAGAPLTLAQRALRDRITAGATRTPARAPRRSLWIGIATPLAALAMLVIVLVMIVPFGAAPAAAYGPRPLEYREIPLSADEVLERAIAQLTADPAGGEAERRSRVTSWSLSYSPDAVPEKQLVIEPFVQESSWNEDLSGSLRRWAGTPFYADGPTDRIPRESEYEPGQLIGEERFGPGEYSAVFPELLEIGVTGVIAQPGYLPPGAMAGDVTDLVESILMQWTLTDRDQADVLDLVGDYEGIDVLGSSVDRLGRDVIALEAAAVADPDTRVVLLLSADTGGIVAVEHVSRGTNPHLPVPDGTVLSYSLWEDRG